jgi:hypothetical protein
MTLSDTAPVIERLIAVRPVEEQEMLPWARRIARMNRCRTPKTDVTMPMQRALAAATVFATLILGAWRLNSAPMTAVPLAAPAGFVPDACALLTEADVSAALEVKSMPGKRVVESSPKACIWSDDPSGGFRNRRVTLTITPVAGFDAAKSNLATRLTIEPVAGVGDDAYYEIFRTSETPMLAVKKGGTAFVVRILNGLKLKAFAREAVKAKEAELGKDAAAKL